MFGKCKTAYRSAAILIIVYLSIIANAGFAQIIGVSADIPENQQYQKHNIFSSEAAEQLARYHRDKPYDPSAEGPGDNFSSLCSACEKIEGFVPMGEISDTVRVMVGKSRIVNKSEAVKIQRSRGVVETGLSPDFIGEADCPEIDSEKWAIDYSHKRPWPALHKGIDIPQRSGTPILAVAAGTVVGKFKNAWNRKGVEVMIRHSPGQTGLPYWTYSQYTHLLAMSPLKIGQSVRMGEEVGKTSNTGKMGRRIRRDALHFAILYSKQPAWSNDGRFVTPKDGYWMDPNAFYRLAPPFDSQSIARLPKDHKRVSVPYVRTNGSLIPSNTKRIWPYPCD